LRNFAQNLGSRPHILNEVQLGTFFLSWSNSP